MMIYETKREKNQKEKERIFKIAMQLMKKIGYDNLTIRSICDYADISTGMFYKYFESKESLLSYYYVQAQSEFVENFKINIDDIPLEEQLVLFYEWYASYTVSFGLDFCINFFNTKNQTMNTDTIYNQMIEITNNYIDKAVSKGFVLPEGMTASILSRDLCILIKGLIFDWCAHVGDYDLPKATKRLMSKCVKGLLAQ